MSTYRQRLQEALLRRSFVARRPRINLYALAELVAYAAFASGWLVAIVTHL